MGCVELGAKAQNLRNTSEKWGQVTKDEGSHPFSANSDVTDGHLGLNSGTRSVSCEILASFPTCVHTFLYVWYMLDICFYILCVSFIFFFYSFSSKSSTSSFFIKALAICVLVQWKCNSFLWPLRKASVEWTVYLTSSSHALVTCCTSATGLWVVQAYGGS